jgi:thymidylate kinase
MKFSNTTMDKIIGFVCLAFMGGFIFSLFALCSKQLSEEPLHWLVFLIVLGIVILAILTTAYLGAMLVLYPPERAVTASDLLDRVTAVKQSQQKKSPGRMIIISGVDGCGKSSQLDWIREELEKSGQEYVYVNLRWASYLSYIPLGLARLLGYAPRKFSARANTNLIHHRYQDFWLMKAVWPPLFVIDMWIDAMFKVIIPMKQGKVVICDRFVVDGIVDVAAMIDAPHLLDSNFAIWLLMLLPPHAENIIIDIEPETAYDRKLDVPTLDSLVSRQPLFLHLAKKMSLPVVDGNQEFTEVQKQISKILELDPS